MSKWVSITPDMVLRGKMLKYVDTDQEDNLNMVRLETFSMQIEILSLGVISCEVL